MVIARMEDKKQSIAKFDESLSIRISHEGRIKLAKVEISPEKLKGKGQNQGKEPYLSRLKEAMINMKNCNCTSDSPGCQLQWFHIPKEILWLSMNSQRIVLW